MRNILRAGAVQAGLERLVGEALSKNFRRGEGLMRIDRLLVDMGWEPAQGIIAAVKHKVGGTAMMMSKGVGIRASRQPMSTWKRRPGEQHGHYWCIPNVSRSREFPHVLFDANHWKTFVHTALATAPGDRGSLTLFGRATDHELFARHIAESEQWVDVQALGRTVREWSPRPAKPDNHWLDCLVGCAVAASLEGIRTPGEGASRRIRKRYTQNDLRRNV